MNRYVRPSWSCRSVSRLMTCDCVDTSSDETGSSSTSSVGLERERPGDRDPLALAAGELVRRSGRSAYGAQTHLRRAARGRRSSRARPFEPQVHLERLADRLGDRLARIERRVRVLEDHLHVAARVARSPRLSSSAISAPPTSPRPRSARSSRSTSRATVDLPDPDSPDEPERLARRDREVDAVDRAHRRRPRGAAGPLRTGKSLRSPRTSTSTPAPPSRGAPPPSTRRRTPRAASRARSQLVRATCTAPRRRRGGSDAHRRAAQCTRPRRCSCTRSANRQPTGHRVGARHLARDHGERLARAGCSAASTSSSPAEYGCRGRCEHRVERRLLDHLPGVHDHDPVADVGDHAEVVGDEDDRHARCRAAACGADRGSAPGS